MTLENIYYIGQTVAVALILASLGAILFQMRQANKLAKLESSRAIWLDASERVYSHADDSERAAFLQKALFDGVELTDSEKTRLYLLLSSMFTTFENGFTMHRSGMMDERFWPRMRDSMRDYISPPRGRRWWALAKKRTFGGDPEFCAEVETLLAEIDQQAEE